MSSTLIDSDLILSMNEYWTKLDQDWKAVDLETDDDQKLSPVFSSLDLRKTTFDSPFLFKTAKKKKEDKTEKEVKEELNYKNFMQDLEVIEPKDLPLKEFYFISGQILSALSVEEICDKIDDIFKSVEKLCSTTSTVRQKKKPLPEIVQGSMSATDFSFDDTADTEKEKCDDDDVDRFIDEAFDQLNSTIANLTKEELNNVSDKGTVSCLVEKFSSILNSPVVNFSPRRKRHCNDRFRDLAEFWNNKAKEGI